MLFASPFASSIPLIVFVSSTCHIAQEDYPWCRLFHPGKTDLLPSSAGAEARGQMSWWRRGSHAGHGPHPKEERVQLNCFWFEGSEEAVLPSKTSTAVLELATAVLESSSINVGWTLVQMQEHFWFLPNYGLHPVHCLPLATNSKVLRSSSELSFWTRHA